MENVVDLNVECYSYSNYAKFTIESVEREIVMDFLNRKIITIRIQKGDSEFITRIDFEKETIEREEELTKWLESNFKNTDFIDYKLEIIKGFKNNVVTYMKSLTASDCKELFLIYQAAESYDGLAEWLFEGSPFSFIHLMCNLHLQVEDNKEDNLLKLYTYIVGEEFRTEGERHIKITNSTFLEVFKKDITIEYRDNERKDRITSMHLIQLFPVKDTVKLNRLKQNGICLSDSRGIVLVPKSNIQENNSTLFCSV